MGSAGSVPAVYDDPAQRVTILFIVLTTLAIVSRGISRHLQRARLGVDDVLVYLAYVLNLGLLVTCLLEINHGAVNLPRLAKLTPAQKITNKDLTIALGILYTLAIITVKISVLFLYSRIFTVNDRWFHVGWWANFILLMPCYTVFTFTLLGLQVTNNLQFGKNNLSKYGSQVSGSINAVSDLLVLVLPIGMVMKLMLPRREKAAILGIFSLGLVATSISIMRTARFQIKRDHKWNAAYSFYNDMILTSTECSVGLICVCLMVIKPILRASRDLAISSTRSLLSFGSGSGGRSHGRSTGSNSIRSDNISLQSRRPQKDGITAVYEYDVQTKDVVPGSAHNRV